MTWVFVACLLISQRLSASLVSEVFDGTIPPVVYLRSFADDAGSPWRLIIQGGLGGAPGLLMTLRTRTPEGLMCEKLSPLGPIMAIGRPGEAMPPLGATRMYVRDPDWQTVAADLIDRSRVLVLRAGETAGLLWELKQVMKRLDPHQVLILLFFPPGLRRRSRQESYDLFRALVAPLLPRPLPEHIGEATLLYFGDAWVPYLLGPTPHRGDPGSFNSDLKLHPLGRKIQNIATIFDPGKSFFDSRGLKWLLVLVAIYILVLMVQWWQTEH
jgi:hypothetical protein